MCFAGKQIFYPRNKDVFSKGQVEFIEYLSESPEEKTMNRDELCGRSILVLEHNQSYLCVSEVFQNIRVRLM